MNRSRSPRRVKAWRTRRPRRVLTWLATLAMGLALLSLLGMSRSRHRDRHRQSRPSSLPLFYHPPNDVSGHERVAFNQTLGFERIFVLNLRRRVDRRDAMRLMGLASDLHMDFWSAQDGQSIHDVRLPTIKALPGLRAMSFNFSAGQLGCYRSNLDILSHIVDRQIASALILQDDAEWDVDLRQQLEKLQGPLFTLLEAGESSAQPTGIAAAPWRHGSWDILWLGPSYEYAWPEPEHAPYVLYHDWTVADGDMAEPGGAGVFAGYQLKRAQEQGDASERVRLVQRSRQPLGMAAYAVSLAGAAKILASASQAIEQPFDSTICALSRPRDPQGFRDHACVQTGHLGDSLASADDSILRSYSVWPPLVSQFRAADGQRDSDLSVNRPKGPLQTQDGPGYALEIRNGVRQRVLSAAWRWQ